LERITAGCWRIGLTGVNAYVLDGGNGCVLVDTGLPRLHPAMIRRALRRIGRRVGEVTDILITHQHVDHAGGLAQLATASQAAVWVHALDAPEIAAGSPPRRGTGRGPLTSLMARIAPDTPVGPAATLCELTGGERLAMGLEAVHSPGHTAGHTAFLWPEGGVLFAGDAASRWLGRLGHAPIAEDWENAVASLARLGALDFEIAAFGHGRVLRGNAAAALRSFAERPDPPG
jgi:glyoxylase-like metal-dependent hydrolase (beta-lactamase superfamily II)